MTSEQFTSQVSKEFLSKLSHHTRSPFNGLLGFSELLLLNQQRLKPEDATEYVLRVNMLAKKAFLSSENMILWLKIASGHMQAMSTPVLFSGAYDHAYNLNKEGLQLKKVDFEGEVEPNFTLTGDSFLVNSLIANMVSKAVKLCSDASLITLTAKTVNDKATVSVVYSGMQVESEVVRNFFSHATRSSAADLFAPELDIELWICYHLAKTQHMHFSVRFPEDKMTEFVLEM
jgi:K+-sensing histidine kinase KdpD